MKVADVMSRYVDFVSPNHKVKEAALIIFGRGINGVPVCKGKKVVGFLTEKDILSKFYPSMSEYMDDPLHAGDFEGMEKKLSEITELTVDKIMSKNPITVTPETPLLKAQSLMLTQKVGRLAVVNANNNLVGMISAGDIFRSAVGDKIIFTENEEYNDWLTKTYYQAVDVKDRMEHEMPDLLKLFIKNKVNNVLDIGCGTGDHAIELARKGFKVVGVDRSEEMIKEANKRKNALSEEVMKRLKFKNCDLEDEACFDHGENFDAAIIMGNTLSHNPNNYKEIIRKAIKKLSKKGIIIFQITNFDKVLKSKNRLLNFNFGKLKEEADKEYAFLEFYDKPVLPEKTILKTFGILVSENHRKWKWVGVRNSLMAYTNKKIILKVIRKEKLARIAFFGGFFDGKNWDYLFRKPFNPMESDWMNIIAYKET